MLRHLEEAVTSRLILLLLLCMVACQAALGQFDTAVVLGTVRDATGGVIPGAKVMLTNTATGISSTATTDENGNYQFFNVKIGTYRVAAEMTGFSTAVADDVPVTVNARQRVDLLLPVGAVTETVEVIGAAKLVETDSSERGQVIHTQQIVELPLNGRAYSDLTLLTTGVRRSSLASVGAPREGSFNVNGLRSTYNNFLLDGVDNNAYGTSNQGFSNQVIQPSPDGVAEFKVATNNMSAEFGRSGGAVINASLKSGANEFHGSAWEFVRNTRLNAVGFFKPRSGKPTLHRNQFGLTFGGPIVRNRTFFFLDYEGFREIAKSVSFSSLPTLNDRSGTFDKAVRNPLTGETFPANTPIPASRISAFAQKVMADLPPPNGPGRSNNFQTLVRDKNFNDKFDVKIDNQFNSKMSGFVRLSHRKVNIFNEPTIPGLSGGGGNGFTRVLNQQLAGGFTYTVTPASLLEFRLGLSKTRAGKEPPSIGGPSMRELYGISGLPEDRRLTGGLTAQNIAGFSGLGRQATNPQWQHPFVVNPRVNYSWIVRRHALKAGYEFQRIHTEIQDVNPLYGRDTYSGTLSRPAGGPADNATYNLADFLLGLRSQYALVNFFVAQYRQRLHFLYLQDDFKITPKLTLNLGLRYEYATPQWEAENRLSNFDPGSNSMVRARGGSLAERSQMNPDRNNFAPRVGFAYSVTPKTVIRSGYGISSIHFNRSGGGNILAINGPQVVIATIEQRPGDANFRTTQQGYPEGLAVPQNFDPLQSTVSYLPRDTRTGYVQNWFFSLQREIAGETLFDVAYVGNRAVKLLLFGDFNQARPNGPTEAAPLQQRRPISSFAAISTGFPAGWSNYHGLQVRLERRAVKGLYLLNSFTYSKAMDNVSQALEDPNGNSANPQNVRNLRAEKSVSAYDQTVTNVTSLVWHVPLGKGRRFGAKLPPLVDGLVGGWQLSAINNMWSGQPMNLRYSPPDLFKVTADLPAWLGGTSFRPNVTGEPVTPKGQRTIDNYLNRDNVQIPSDRSQPFGNAGRNVARSHAFYQLDLGIQKDFPLPREGMRLQFRSEFFNTLNKTNFRPANGDRSSAAFGTIRSTFDPRQIQFALKLYF